MALLYLSAALGILAMAAFVAAKGVIAVMKRVRPWVTARDFSDKEWRGWFVIAWVACAYLIPAGYWRYQAVGYVRQAVPPELEIDGLVHRDEARWGGCRIGVFRLSDRTVARVRAEGLAFLQTATSTRTEPMWPRERPFSYETWRRTPPEPWDEGGVMRARWCLDGNPAVLEAVYAELDREGGYFTARSSSNDLVVLPGSGWLVVSLKET